MIRRRLFLLVTAILCCSIVFGQEAPYNLNLKAGRLMVKSNLSVAAIDSFNKTAFRWNKAFAIIQFESLPTEADKKELAAQGIDLLDYIPDHAYTVSIRKNLDVQQLKNVKARAVILPSPQQKLAPLLAKGLLPAWAVKIPGTVDLTISFPKTFSSAEIISYLKQINADVLSTDLINFRVVNIRLSSNRLTELADQPFVEYVQPTAPKDQPLNFNSRILSHANLLNAPVANGGKGLNGEGVVIGVGDNADVQFHVDFSGRLIDRAAITQNTHGTHTTGTAAGAGIVNEYYRGYAPKATIVSQSFNGIFSNASTYVQDYGMVVTNNSYGAIISCDYNGTYDLYSRILDQQAFDFPYLQHVFAAGNSGGNVCDPYPSGFKTVLGAYQSAKNIICVGNVDADGNLYYSSSKGPVKDGRLKPDITAMGAAVTSTVPVNGYGTDWGTSMAAPAVTGGIALLYQRYRQLHGNANPKSALIKALICNGATDRGNSGPDYSYGYGSLNLLRSLDMLENNRFVTGAATNNSADNFNIALPANTAQLKVMLYWHDPAPSLLSGKALVNDLDLEVINPSSATLLPLILDSSVAKVNNAAATGPDHTNNMEQIVVNNPVSGNYTLRVKGTAINQNPSQEYFVVYDVIPNSLQLTSPVGGEGLVPGEFARINWESYGDESNTFTLQYSTDDGATWTDINTNLSGSSRFFTWQIPSTPTDKGLVRILKNGTAQVSTSKEFAIVGVPSVALSAVQCEGYISLNWNSVPGATNYEVMMLQGSEMVTVSNTTGTSYTFNNLSKDSTYWVSVRAGINGRWGRRAVAVSRQPADGNCSGNISDNDLKVNAVVSPVSGRKFTATELSASHPVIIEIKNLDDAPVSGFEAKYSIDGGQNWVSENVTATIAGGGVYTYTFAAKANLSAVQSYNVIAVVKNNNADANTGNDTLKIEVKQLNNQPLNLSVPFLENMENSAETTYTTNTTGLNGLDRFDLVTANAIGRLRTFVNSGIAYSGSKALTIDVNKVTSGNNVNYLIGTFNLANYDAAKNAVRFDFQFNVHGSLSPDSNKVWIRGSDASPWIEVYNIYPDQNLALGQYKVSPGIELSDSLQKHGQNFSSSFQVKWAENSPYPAVDKQSAGGFTLDDIHLYEVFNDVQMVRIDTPVSNSCGLTAATLIKVTVKNGSKTALANVPVKYSINNGGWISETIASLPAETSLQYTFNKSADLSKSGTYTIKVVADYSLDSYHLNDTATSVVQNTIAVAAFPYLEDFEKNNGGWYAQGINSSWEYGTPASVKIKGAASGAKAWKTRLAGNYNDLEYSFLYSPCFRVGGLSKPTLSFSAALDLENCGTTLCDAFWIEYSTDGKFWKRLLDSAGSSTNWYNSSGKFYWSVEDYTRWHVATVALPTGLDQIRLRFVMYSDPAVNHEGVAIDDIHVYDNPKEIYAGSTMAAPVVQNIAGGTAPVNFESDGKLIATLFPNNQNLGATNIRAYINAAEVRHTDSQYYHNRNITIKPQSAALTDSVTVRFYFLDSEVEALLNASSCTDCRKPSSAYELSVSKYDDYSDSLENGTIEDDKEGLWSYIPSGQVKIVPFDKGYYAEFKVKSFSEFWLNSGGVNNNTILPVKLMTFQLQKQNNNDVKVNWAVSSESDVLRYEIEVARGSEDLQNNVFEKIGSVASKGNSNSAQEYSFTDAESFKTGVRYYRLKIINTDGSFTYSLTRSIMFNDEITWQVFPNPSSGVFYLVYHLNDQETISITAHDALGRTVKTYTLKGNGFAQKLTIDLSPASYAAGVYLLQVSKDQKNQTFKLYKK